MLSDITCFYILFLLPSTSKYTFFSALLGESVAACLLHINAIFVIKMFITKTHHSAGYSVIIITDLAAS